MQNVFCFSKKCLDAKAISNESGLSWKTSHNSFAAYVSHKPTLAYGTMATDILLFVRKNGELTLEQIILHIKEKRVYKEYDGCRRSVIRVLAQLTNWDLLYAEEIENGSIVFLNCDNKEQKDI